MSHLRYGVKRDDEKMESSWQLFNTASHLCLMKFFNTFMGELNIVHITEIEKEKLGLKIYFAW